MGRKTAIAAGAAVLILAGVLLMRRQAPTTIITHEAPKDPLTSAIEAGGALVGKLLDLKADAEADAEADAKADTVDVDLKAKWTK